MVIIIENSRIEIITNSQMTQILRQVEAATHLHLIAKFSCLIFVNFCKVNLISSSTFQRHAAFFSVALVREMGRGKQIRNDTFHDSRR